MTIDRHTLAIINLAGSGLDVLGALYLAYDLLGGEHGPLRVLTRAVTYGALFGFGFGLALGPVFGVAAGGAHGITLAIEFSRASRQRPSPGWWFDALMSAIRGSGFLAGGWYLYGARFGIALGVLSTVGQVVAYRFGVSPAADYQPGKRPRITRFQFLAVINRTVGYTIAGYLSSLFARHEHAVDIGVRTGLTLGIVTGVVVACFPFIEWGADHIPARCMGALGIALILAGFALQSTQYWVVLMDVTVR